MIFLKSIGNAFFVGVTITITTSSTSILASPSSKEDDLVTSLPGYEDDMSALPFEVYSGYLTVPGPFTLTDYGSLEIHYQFQTANNGPANDSDSDDDDDSPILTWHQGGPGGSSIAVGLYTEMGAFQIDDNGLYLNKYAWNKGPANMLYLESPAGSGDQHGFSACLDKDGNDVNCEWDDVSQAEAYAHTLLAFYEKFPEYATRDLYLTGESYFGQYGPNIAHYILSFPDFYGSINLKGMALGNACWGGDQNHVLCNGPYHQRHVIDLYHGKGLLSKKLYTTIKENCDFLNVSEECQQLLFRANHAVGQHNPYNVYDNCESMSNMLESIGKSSMWYTQQIVESMPNNLSFKNISSQALFHDDKHKNQNLRVSDNYDEVAAEKARALQLLEDHDDHEKDGGFDWSCGGMVATNEWIVRDDVREALHLTKPPHRSKFRYYQSGPASITLYPYLIPKLRLLIYNGDADAVVPYLSNEEWIGLMEAQGHIVETEAWRPWFTDGDTVPSGSVTSYKPMNTSENSDGGNALDFTFLTIRLAGHMVPTYQPGPSLYFLQKFLAGEPY